MPWEIWPFGERGVSLNHYYNPLYNIGYYKLENGGREEKGESLIHRMNDDIITGDFMEIWGDNNEWSYQMARDLYYAALTGNSKGVKSTLDSCCIL